MGRAWPSGNTRGFGDVRPSLIDNGGDPTGLVTDVRWSSWGDAQAHGTGITTYVAPDETVAEGEPEPVTIIAFDLTICDGHRAYRHLAYFFPRHGESFNPDTNGETQYDICTGP